MHFIKITFAIFVAFFLFGCSGQSYKLKSITPFELENSETWILRSTVNEVDYKISVALPEGYDPNSDESYRVLYVVDSNMQFSTVAETARNLAAAGKVEDQIVVGIGYAVPSSWPNVQPHRSFDLTPTKDEKYIKRTNKFISKNKNPLLYGTGNAPNFSIFLEEKLIPAIAKRYKVNENRTFFGHSFGGLYGTYLVFNHTELFTDYILASPSYWWDNEIIFDYEEKYAQTHTDMPINIFLSVGELEQTKWLEKWAAVDNVFRIENLLKSRGYPTLKVGSHLFKNETHMSVVPASISRGLRYIAQKTKDKVETKSQKP